MKRSSVHKGILTSCLVTAAVVSAAFSGVACAANAGDLVIEGEVIADAGTFAQAKQQTLNLYTGYVQSPEKALIDDFTKDTGIKVNMIRLTPNQLLERVLSEQGAGKLGADVIRTSDYPNALSMEKAGVWKKYMPPIISGTPQLSQDNGSFNLVFDSVYTIGYNTQLADKNSAPHSWADMVNGKWKKKIGIVQGGSGGSTASLNRFMISKLGEDYFKKYYAQDPVIYSSLGQEAIALARGEISVGTVKISDVNILAKKENAPLMFVVPTEGVAVYDYFLGMTQSVKNEAAAKVFINYNLSKHGQKIFAAIGEYPARSDVASPTVLGVTLPAIGSPQYFRLSPQDSLKYSKDDLKKWNADFKYTK
ncbi:MAG: extracellular solute-binding protein [Castellaniella sp.]|uniref:ABC transporter substrate-binding protein n=1 Tax=Castellaniella sp. TaxID=1955812 RepID=UPI001208E525|nr:extracellular solute-binding protein [Castellaniella sp.]TAN25789.1 MAG: extracellular solute-binding protein [Castellaniella sp.]